MENTLEIQASIIARAKDQIAKNGYYKLSTCDARNWNMGEHVAMLRLTDSTLDGLKLSYNISYGVHDWLFIPKN